MKNSITRKDLILALLVRFCFILFLVPELHVELFSPFIQNFINEPTLDPWQSWLDNGGQSDAFPYGPMMLLFFSILAFALGFIVDAQVVQISIALSLVVVEVLIWHLAEKNEKMIHRRFFLLIYFSPILLVATYIHGQLDVFPAALIFGGLLFLKKGQWIRAGLVLGFSAAAKFSALLLLPLVVAFLMRNSRYRLELIRFTISLIPGLILTFIPLCLSGYRTMVAETPQTAALLGYSIKLNAQFSILMAPLLVAFFLALVFKYKRANLRMLFVFCTIFLSAIPLLMPSSPGWFLWGLPCLLLVSATLPIRYQVLVTCLSIFEAIQVLLLNTTSRLRFANVGDLDRNLLTRLDAPPWVSDLSLTFTLLIGVFVLWKVLQISLASEDTYKLSKAPLSVAVAGDSGTGKDTLCASLASVFGESRCTFVLGDDYHSHERGASAWNTRTHLNPKANELDRLATDSLDLLSGKSVWSRHYDHRLGRFTKARKIKSGELIAISGLHVLTLSQVLKVVDLSVFLDMDDNLRKYFKITRDTNSRNHTKEKISESLAEREPDRQTYIQPQMRNADLILRIKPANSITRAYLDEYIKTPELDMVAELRGLTFGSELVRNFNSIAGAHVTLEYSSDPGTTILNFYTTSWIESGDLASVAYSMIRNPDEILTTTPVWDAGSRGIQQLLLVLSLLERRSDYSRKVIN
jgi:uridine kinase/Gpi18-like mannosyltransferase